MATDENESREKNAYFAELDAIAAKLDEAAKILTPDESDDGTPPDGGAKTESNSYFASFRNIATALARVNEALAERIAGGGGITEEFDPVFRKWRDEGYSLTIGKGANATSNGVAIGWNSTAGTGTGTGASDSGAVAVGKAAQAWGIEATALGKGAVAGSSGARTTLATIQLGAGQNTQSGTLQFRMWQLLDASGHIPADRLTPAATTYRMVRFAHISSGQAFIANHAVNTIAMTGESVRFVLPEAIGGRARSFLLRIEMEAATEWGFEDASLQFESDSGGVFDEIEAGSTATFVFTEVVAGRFMVARKDAKTVETPTLQI